jgi:hypothetical protein
LQTPQPLLLSPPVLFLSTVIWLAEYLTNATSRLPGPCKAFEKLTEAAKWDVSRRVTSGRLMIFFSVYFLSFFSFKRRQQATAGDNRRQSDSCFFINFSLALSCHRNELETALISETPSLFPELHGRENRKNDEEAREVPLTSCHCTGSISQERRKWKLLLLFKFKVFIHKHPAKRKETQRKRNERKSRVCLPPRPGRRPKVALANSHSGTIGYIGPFANISSPKRDAVVVPCLCSPCMPRSSSLTNRCTLCS